MLFQTEGVIGQQIAKLNILIHVWYTVCAPPEENVYSYNYLLGPHCLLESSNTTFLLMFTFLEPMVIFLLHKYQSWGFWRAVLWKIICVSWYNQVFFLFYMR